MTDTSVGPSTLPVVSAALPAGVVGLFTTRHGGVSRAPWDELNLAAHVGDAATAVAANRDRLVAFLGCRTLVTVEQVHGSKAHIVDGGVSHAGIGDALVCTSPSVAVMVQVADCLPVLFADPEHQVVAAAHAGRRGLAGGVLQATVEAMRAAGAVPADTVALIGPGVCGACYEVPAEMRDEVDATVPGSAASTRDGRPSLDLPAGALGVLERLGLGQIRRSDSCTVEDARFYSHRRDGVTGRFAGVVMLTQAG